MQRVGWLIALVFVSGCSERPKAPALSADPIYRNAREGFRFVAPEGWTQTARSEIPPGPQEKERLLVRYEGVGGDGAAALEVTCADLPEDIALPDYLAGTSQSISTWKPVGQPATVALNGVSGTRYSFQSGTAMRETVAVRRAARVYFFTILCSAKDAKSRDLGRHTISSIVWE